MPAPAPKRLLGPDGRPLRAAPPVAAPRAVRARYDAAQTNATSENHWANADSLSALAANSPQVRRTLRNRSRYETANNGYASGIVETLAYDTIGTGPRLQVRTPDGGLNERLAAGFEEWTAAVGLAEKLRTMRESRAVDGEAFAVLITNPPLPTPVKLDLRLVECDQVATPFAYLPTPNLVDGIELDAYGNPAFYQVLKEHPGDLLHFGEWGEFDRVPADLVVHWFKRRRPGQYRGVPELTPALPLFAQLRRYTLATLSAAEVAALFAALLKTTAPPDADDTTAITPFDTQEIVRGMMTALPDGYDVTQLKAEQPTTTYKEFKNEVLNEFSRPLHMPHSLAAGDSKDMSYAGGRLEHQVYQRAIGVDRYFLECHVLDRVLRAWLAEARLASPAAVAGLDPDPARLPRHRWGWDGFKHVDPEKEANAQALRLKNGVTTMDAECAEDGNDWREVARQRAEERAYYLGLGLPYPGDPAPAPVASPPRPDPNADPNANDNPAPAAEGTMTRTRIAAAAEPSSLTLAAAPVAVRAAAGEGKRPTFDIVGYTGAVMSLEGFYSPVIVDLAGLRSAGQEMPALRDHDTARIVGQTDSVKVDAQGVRLTGVITGDNPDAAEVVSQAKNGFRWRASIGASVDRREFLDAGKTATVNGREVTGPLVIARETTLREISFVALGADGQTSAAVAASNPLGTPSGAHHMSFEAWLQAKGFDPSALTDPQKSALKAAFHAEHPQPAPPAPPAPTPAPAPTPPAPAPDPSARQRLENIFAEQRRETLRIEEITRITAQALRDRPGMAETLKRMSDAAIEAKADPVTFELEILRACRAPAAAGFAVHPKDARANGGVIEAALCKTGGLEGREKHFDERTLQAADDRFRDGLGLCDVLHVAARENGWQGHSVKADIAGVLRACFPRLDVRAEGFSTLSLPNIFSNVANKFLAAGFNAVEDTWRMIAARRNAADFKQFSTMSLTGSFMYEKVGPAGELKHATAGELLYTNQVETYGRMFAVTRKHIIDDDLGALTAIPKKLGRGAALSLNDVFWKVFLNNSAFFTSGNANLISGAGTALSLDALGTAYTTFSNQTDVDGLPVAVTPKILLVPNALNVLARNLMNSTNVVNNTTANTTTLGNNPFAGMFDVVRSSYLSNASYTGYSTTAWYLLASPDDLPTIEVAFLNGRETPVVESADAEFDTLGVQFRGFYDFGSAMQEYRAGLKSAGA